MLVSLLRANRRILMVSARNEIATQASRSTCSGNRAVVQAPADGTGNTTSI